MMIIMDNDDYNGQFILGNRLIGCKKGNQKGCPYILIIIWGIMKPGWPDMNLLFGEYAAEQIGGAGDWVLPDIGLLLGYQQE